MTDRERATAAWEQILSSTISGQEWQKRVTYGYKGKPYNWQNTAIGRAKLLLDQIDVAQPAPPVDPVTTIKDAPALGINQYIAPASLHDLLIDGTGETGILIQGSVNPGCHADGTTIKRVKMTRVGEFNSVGYGKHGIYGKATDLVGEDVDMTLSKYCADGLSARFPSVWRRFTIRGEHQHAITYYETGAVKGTVLFEDFDGTFNNPNTAIWIDREANYQATVIADLVFRRVHLTGPSQWFLASYDTVFQGSVTLEGCTLNGNPVTAANVRGIGSRPLVIS